MAKKDKDKGNKRGDAVRSAVDEAFSAAADQAQVTRDRAQEVVDELTQVASRVRDALDDTLRPSGGDELRDLGAEVAALRDRVAKLESSAPKRRTASATARKPAASRAKKPAGGRKASGSSS